MSTPSGNLYHPINKHPIPIYVGFSWPNLFFGTFWFLYKNMWGWAIIAFFSSIMTNGLSGLFFPFFANQLHQTHLINSGYLGSEIQEVSNNNQNIKKQLLLYIIIIFLVVGFRLLTQNSFKEFKLEFNNFKFNWDFILDEDEEYKIKANPHNKNQLNNI